MRANIKMTKEVAAAIPIRCPPPGVKSLGGDALEFQQLSSLWLDRDRPE